MNKTNRAFKAIAVVIVIGLGILHNMNDNKLIMMPLSQNSERWETAKVEAKKETESKLYIYTKALIKTSIQHLISNI